MPLSRLFLTHHHATREPCSEECNCASVLILLVRGFIDLLCLHVPLLGTFFFQYIIERLDRGLHLQYHDVHPPVGSQFYSIDAVALPRKVVERCFLLTPLSTFPLTARGWSTAFSTSHGFSPLQRMSALTLIYPFIMLCAFPSSSRVRCLPLHFRRFLLLFLATHALHIEWLCSYQIMRLL